MCSIYGFALLNSILDMDEEWRPSVTVKQMLHGVFEMLDNPNVSETASECGVVLHYVPFSAKGCLSKTKGVP